MYDVVIVGSGIVGLVNALLLAKNTTLRIAIVDAKLPELTWSETAYDPRVYAITPASQGILESLHVWPQVLAKRACPFTHMQVWDGQGRGELVFDHAQLNVPALGYIIEENLLRSALFEKVAEYSQLDWLCPLTLTDLQEQEEGIELSFSTTSLSSLQNTNTLRTKLLIGADGAQSWVRERAGLALRVQDYQHTALIAQVETEEPHLKKARQVFLSGTAFPKGPLAFLPLMNAHQCSIVWSTAPEAAQELLNMSATEFQKTLAEAFSFRLGQIQSVSKRQTFPLYERHVENYVKNRLALIGDAAHTLHPLAGQGVNLGIADATALAEQIVEAVKKDRDFSSLNTLRRYERARKGNNWLMLSTVKLLKSLFSSESKSLGLLRSQGMIVTNHFPLLKNLFARYAMG